MNEYNYNQEEPDQHWEGFKKMLILVIILLAATTVTIFKYCKSQHNKTHYLLQMQVNDPKETEKKLKWFLIIGGIILLSLIIKLLSL